MGLKCYRGGFDSTEGAEQGEDWQGEPTLVDCGYRNEDVCYSGYAKTEVELGGDGTFSAGTWIKYCADRSDFEDFDDIQSDRCIEAKQWVVVSIMSLLFYVTSSFNFHQCFSNHCMKQVTFLKSILERYMGFLHLQHRWM